jgi:para-aminobenzoate synthetase/4-amino-4-deoxychorismate lyase
VGYLAPGDAAQARTVFNVAIRTVTVDKQEGAARYGVGGGITWDSRSESEYEEARVKAQLLAERRPEFSLLETIRWDPGTGYAWRDRHLDRILASAEYFRFPADRGTLESVLDEAVVGAVEPNRVRLLIRRDGATEAMALPHPVRFSDGPDGGGEPLTFAVDDAPVSPQNVMLFHKTTARGIYDERLKRHPYADDVVLVNDRGEVTEFSIGNLAVRRDGRWITPPLDSGCLPGIYCDVLIGRGFLHEGVVTVDELRSAEAVAFLNSVQGWRPARPLRVSPVPMVASGGGS